jgi:dihydrodipicolinate synthase/N-acetylneuraminate lyase
MVKLTSVIPILLVPFDNEVRQILEHYQPLFQAVSGPGHEFSLHARKYLMKRAGYIQSAYVRRPTVTVNDAALTKLCSVADSYTLRISQPFNK